MLEIAEGIGDHDAAVLTAVEQDGRLQSGNAFSFHRFVSLYLSS